MSWLGSPEFKVGAMVIVVTTLIGGMALKVAEGPGVLGRSNEFHFMVDNAGGLVKNSAVKMAGIKVGVIRDIILRDSRAKIVVDLEPNVKLTESVRAELRADGILGDKHVELVPGKEEDPLLKSGSEIADVKSGGGLDDIMGEVRIVAKNMNELLETLNKAAGKGDDSTTIGRIVKNIEVITQDLKEVTTTNKGKINEIVERIRNLSKNIDTYINEESLARVDRSLKNIEEITGKLNRGEGTLGRLINDEETVDELNSAIQSVNKFLGGADKMQTSVDFHSEFMTETSDAKSYLGLKIQPGLDRYYEIQVIDDPNGVKREVDTTTTPAGGTAKTENTVTTFRNKIKLTAIFAKNFWDFTIKGGLIENYGGVAFDYRMLHDQLVLSTEFFNFKDLYWRAFVRYNFFKGVYMIGGHDNILDADDVKGSPFVGAGIFITNDDLKMLASKMSFR